MTDLEQFQALHGRDWAELIRHPAFAAGLAIAREEKIKGIGDLSDNDISSKGAIVLADLRGFLQYESGLLGLHEKKEFVFQDLGPEEYPSPIDEASEEQLEEQQISSGVKSESLPSSGMSAHEEIFPTPKAKPRGRPQKKGKKK